MWHVHMACQEVAVHGVLQLIYAAEGRGTIWLIAAHPHSMGVGVWSGMSMGGGSEGSLWINGLIKSSTRFPLKFR